MTDGQKAIPDAGTTESGRSLTPTEKYRAWRARLGDDGAMAELCDYLVAGGHLPGFAREHGYSYTAIRQWIEADATRAALYARAREDRSDTLADEILAIGDEDMTTPVVVDGKVVGHAIDKGKVAQAKLRSDNRKWLAAKMKPRVYGEKLEMATPDLRGASDEALLAKAAMLGIGMVASKMLNGDQPQQEAGQ